MFVNSLVRRCSGAGAITMPELVLLLLRPSLRFNSGWSPCSSCVLSVCPWSLFGIPPPTSLWSRITGPVRRLYKKGKNIIGGARKSVVEQAQKSAEENKDEDKGGSKVGQIVFQGVPTVVFPSCVNFVQARSNLTKISKIHPCFNWIFTHIQGIDYVAFSHVSVNITE